MSNRCEGEKRENTLTITILSSPAGVTDTVMRKDHALAFVEHVAMDALEAHTVFERVATRPAVDKPGRTVAGAIVAVRSMLTGKGGGLPVSYRPVRLAGAIVELPVKPRKGGGNSGQSTKAKRSQAPRERYFGGREGIPSQEERKRKREREGVCEREKESEHRTPDPPQKTTQETQKRQRQEESGIRSTENRERAESREQRAERAIRGDWEDRRGGKLTSRKEKKKRRKIA